jgi:hypothetical protein
MRTICWLLIITIFLSAACSSTRFIEPTEPSYGEVNKKLEGKKATITLMDNQERKGRNAHVTPDSTSWLDMGSGLRQTIPTPEVKQIVVINRRKNTLNGLLWGSIAGASLGLLYVVIVSASDDDEKRTLSEGLFTRQNMKGFTLAAMITTFGLTGLLIGAVGGSSETYVLNE